MAYLKREKSGTGTEFRRQPDYRRKSMAGEIRASPHFSRIHDLGDIRIYAGTPSRRGG